MSESKTYILGRNGLEEIDTTTPVVQVNQVLETHYRSQIIKSVVIEIKE